MLPQQPFDTGAPPISPDGALAFSNLDPYAAKQMAALQATSIAKAGNRYAPGGVSSASYFGGLSTHQLSRPEASASTELNNNAFPSAALQPGQQGPHTTMNMNPAQQQQQRKKQFLYGLGNVMLQRGVPLPPQLTGIPYPPAYDPSTSPWKSLEVSNQDVGVVRIGGKDVDLYRLWGTVLQSGGSAKLSQAGLWGTILPPLDLPEQFMHSSGQPQSTAATLQHYFLQLLGPFEEVYLRKGGRDAQRMQAARPQQGFPMSAPVQGRSGSMSGMPGTFPPVGTLPAVNGNSNSARVGQQMGGAGSLQVPDMPAQGMNNLPFANGQPQLPMRNGAQQMPNGLGGGSLDGAPFNMRRPDANSISATPSLSDLNGAAPVDADTDGRKRKMEDGEEPNGKRARQKTGEPDARNGTQVPTRTIRQPSRRKIEYVPLAREIETAGGRDLEAIQQEHAHAAQRPLKDLNEWGTVDIEALVMSLRSRLSTELSYALTTMSILSIMPFKHTGFPIAQAPDLFEELLDLVEDVAFDGPEEELPRDAPYTPIVTHRQLINDLVEEGSGTFAGLAPKQGLKTSSHGPGQRPGHILLAATNIIRNLALHLDNLDIMGKHDRLLSMLLRLASFTPSDNGGPPTPLSAALSIHDLVTIRKDVVHIILNIGNAIRLSPTDVRDTRRIFDLLASYLVDPTEALPPFQCLLQHSVPSHMQPPKPPTMTDIALEAFTRVSHPDENRQALSAAVPRDALWTLFAALVHRLPVDNGDFQVVARAEWLAYLERVVLALYALAFAAPPPLKRRIKADRALAFAKVALRCIKKLTVLAPNDARLHFAVAARRLVETLRLIDEAGDSFDVSPATMPTLAFGMGYGEHGEARVEKGMGLLSGYQEDITWGVMMTRDLDELMFAELSSLVRVQPE